MIEVGQVYEKVNGPGFHWESELGNLIVITKVDGDEIHYRYTLYDCLRHYNNIRTHLHFQDRFKLVVDV